jgi:hypothetical protein
MTIKTSQLKLNVAKQAKETFFIVSGNVKTDAVH